jgi:ATP-dependent Zn protease
MEISDLERFKTAIHEAGHTIACLYTEHANKLYKTTIVPRGPAAGITF